MCRGHSEAAEFGVRLEWSAMRFRQADLVPFTVGAGAGVLFTVLLISSANPPLSIALATVMVVGTFLTGGIGSVWMGSRAACRYLEFWEVPTWKPLRSLVQVLGAVGSATIWPSVCSLSCGLCPEHGLPSRTRDPTSCGQLRRS